MDYRHLVIVRPCPGPPSNVVAAYENLAIVRRGDPDEMAQAGNLDNLPRPWIPASCPDDLREAVWVWCDAFVRWLNHEYAWRPVHMVPPCWPRHPHIANELPVLAMWRWLAQESLSAEAIEDWHRHTYPLFLDRMTSRLGESSCRTGRHQDWPAESRHAAHDATDAGDDRAEMIYRDTHPPTSIGTGRP
jgi:hypothetical protein